MKLRKRYLKLLMLIFTVIAISIINFTVYAVDHSTGSIVIYTDSGACPRCMWYIKGTAKSSGIRLSLYKYSGSVNGNPQKCGESIDLLNNGSGIVRTTHNVSPDLITGGYGRFDYIYGGQKVTFTDRGTVKLNDSSSPIRAKNVKDIVGYNYEVEGTTWGKDFVVDFIKYLGDDYESVNKKIKELFLYNDFKEEEAGKYYIAIEPTNTFYRRKGEGEDFQLYKWQNIYGTGYEIMVGIHKYGWENKSEPYKSKYFFERVEFKYSLEEPTDNNKSSTCRYRTDIKDEATGMCIVTDPTYMWGLNDSQSSTLSGYIFRAMFVEKNDFKILEGYDDKRYDTYNFIGENSNSIINPSSGGKTKFWYTYVVKNGQVAREYSSYGISVLWMKNVLPNSDDEETDPPLTCKELCGVEGTNQSNCAKQYCEANEPNNSSCYNNCLDIVEDSPGCERETHLVCYSEELKTSDIKVNATCGNDETEDQELKSKTCYDDVKSEKTYLTESTWFTRKRGPLYNLDTINEITVDKRLSYYKIECEETAAFRNLASMKDVYLTPALSSTLYYGYTLDYSKICQIYYKEDHNAKKWTTNYDKSAIKKELNELSSFNQTAVQSRDTLDDKISLLNRDITNLTNENNKLKEDILTNNRNIDNYAMQISEINRLNTCVKTNNLLAAFPCTAQNDNKYTSVQQAQYAQACRSYRTAASQCAIDLTGYRYSISTLQYWKLLLEQENQDHEKTISSNEEIIKKKREEIGKAQGEFNKLGDIVNKIDTISDELKKIKQNALHHLQTVKDKDVADDKEFTNKLTFDVTNTSATSTSQETIELVPVYCIANKKLTTEKYCDLVKKDQYTVTDNGNLTCIDENGEEGKGIYDEAAGKTTYSEKVYYSLPTSYITVNNLGSTLVCHGESCQKDDKTIVIPNAWVFDKFDDRININQLLTINHTLDLSVSGLGACGQFTFDLSCEYQFEKDTVCSKCISDYNDGKISKSEYDACFKENCSCESYCGEDVSCQMKYCPQECEGCEEKETCSEDACKENCDNNYSGANNITCNAGCCRNQCNGAVGCIYNCCTSECDAKKANGHLNEEGYKLCKQMCDCENGGCAEGRDYVYRTINLDRPFPNGDDVKGRTPGANWFGKEKYITQSDVPNSKYYDSTDGRSGDYEYRLKLTSEDIKRIKQDNSLNLSYTEFRESEHAKNKLEQKPQGVKADVYCSYIIHDYLSENGINVTSNINGKDNALGSGCYK